MQYNHYICFLWCECSDALAPLFEPQRWGYLHPNSKLFVIFYTFFTPRKKLDERNYL